MDMLRLNRWPGSRLEVGNGDEERPIDAATRG
jgi:hypothetical protein